jgi:hypothetical protein
MLTGALLVVTLNGQEAKRQETVAVRKVARESLGGIVALAAVDAPRSVLRLIADALGEFGLTLDEERQDD